MQENVDSPIMDIQRYLRLISTVYPTVPQVAQDGVYGQETTLAIREFQRANDREPTGIVDYDTWELLRLTYDLITALNRTDIRGVNFPADYTVDGQNEDEYTHYISIMLNRLSSIFNNIPNVNLGDKYDENTTEAIKEFQRISGLNPNGVTDKQTWQKLTDVYTAYM